ncbi:MAG TPA: BatD family protein [Thermoanaerobaculia bacterium]|nr:BatD family protein [Thermoanaerobaculia bacterium]
MHFALCISVLILFASDATASNSLLVERRTIRLGEQLTIIVSLEGEFSELDDVRVPLHNLTIYDPPSIASEFSWINGEIIRRKVLRYRARAEAAGPALVGPLTLTAGAQRDTLPAIAIEVLPDRAASSNDPAVILRELLATGREPLFVVAEQDAQSVYAGEQVIVTWYLYNAATVQRWQIGSIPKLADFWVEELDVRNARAQTTFIGDQAVQKMAVRRVALYPLRSGRLEVGPLEVEAAILRRTNRGPFSLFEGNLVEVGFSSTPIFIDAQPLPPGPAVSVVGEFTMRCSRPRQARGGPLVVEASVTGRGNLRAAQPPQFRAPPAGDVQRIEQGVSVQRSSDDATMTRRWQYLIFPRAAGTMAIPALQMPVFSPSGEERRLLQCAALTYPVSAAERPRVATGPPASAKPEMHIGPYLAAGIIALACLLFVLPWWRRRASQERQIRAIIGNGEKIQERVHAALADRGIDPAVLLKEGSDRGDAYRSLRSLLDALDRDRIDVDNREREIRRRLRELF